MLTKNITIIATVLTSMLCSLNISFEDTWYRYCSYTYGISQYQNKLYSNTYSGLEIYNIIENGDLEFDEVIEFNGVIKTLKIDQNQGLLFLLVDGYSMNSVPKLYCYKIHDTSLELLFIRSNNPDTLYSSLDCVVTTEKYAIFGSCGMEECYNYVTEELESITYNYNIIIGSFDNKLISYDNDTNTMAIYKVTDINEPTVLYQTNYIPDGVFRKSARKIDDSYVMILFEQGFIILNMETEDNYFIENSLNLELSTSSDRLYPPNVINDNLIYFASEYGENFVYDISDLSSLQQVDYWFEEYIQTRGYSFVELDSGRFLYKQSRNNGIRTYNFDNLQEYSFVSYGDANYFYSSAFTEGKVLILKNGVIEKLDPNTMNVIFNSEIPYKYFRFYSVHENSLILEAYDVDNQTYVVILDLYNGLLQQEIQLSLTPLKLYKNLIFLQNNNEILVKKITVENDLELVAALPASSFSSVSEFDENMLWVSYNEGNYLFNCETYSIDYEYQNEFVFGPYVLSRALKYDNRMLLVTSHVMDEDYVPTVKLYDIEDMGNPVLLDTKYETAPPSYILFEDLILETHNGEPVLVYDKFVDSFSEPLQELDFGTCVYKLVFDYENNRVASESMYNLTTYTYEVTENGLVIVPEIFSSLYNYPNPFNPNTTISFSLPEDGFVELEVYNVKGQLVKSLLNEVTSVGTHSVEWNGIDNSGQKVSSGIYFSRLKTNKEVLNKKMILMK